MRFPCENKLEMSFWDLMVSNQILLLDAKTLAALRTTGGQNLATTPRGHAGTETVGLGPLTLVRLVRALHINSLSYFAVQLVDYIRRKRPVKD